jgi:hypothetical protein
MHSYWRTRVCHVCTFKTLSAKTDRDLKKIIPLYTFGALANAYTEDTFYEQTKYLTKEGKNNHFRSAFRFCSYGALKSYNGKKTTCVWVYRSTRDCWLFSWWVKVKDSLISVGKRINAVGDKPPYAGYFGYEDHNQLENGAQVAKPSWSHVELDGILMYQLH